MDKPPKKHRSLKLTTLGLRTAARFSQTKLTDLWGGDSANQFSKIGEDWFKTLGQLKGAPMKFGQFASQFADMLPPDLAKPLSKLRNQAEPLPLQTLEYTLLDEWGKKTRSQVILDNDALAAASIGQVHRGQYRQGENETDIVVKIRYTDIASSFEKDMQSLKRLIRMGRVLDIPKADLDAIFIEIKARVSEEMNFIRERENLQTLRQHNNSPVIVYPEVVPELCSDSVLAMHYSPGDSLEVAKTYPQNIRNRIGQQLVENLLHQIMVSGVVHADPNPGNYAFRPDGTIIMYDFGCVKYVPESLRTHLHDALVCFREQNWDSLHIHFINMGGVPEKYQNKPVPDPLYALWYDITLQRFLNEKPFDFADPKLHDDAVIGVRKSIAYRKHFRPVADMVFVNRTISGMYWLLRSLGAQVNLQTVIQNI